MELQRFERIYELKNHIVCVFKKLRINKFSTAKSKMLDQIKKTNLNMIEKNNVSQKSGF